MQFRPASILPSAGILQVFISGDPLIVACPHPHANVTLTSLSVTVSTVEAHRTGALNLTGDWIIIASSPKTIDLVQAKTVTQLLGSASLPEGTITSVRLNVSSATASTDRGPVNVVVSSEKLEALLIPNHDVRSGMTTSVVVEPHVICEGSGTFRLTPVLTVTS